jgi:hypothetical protein
MAADGQQFLVGLRQPQAFATVALEDTRFGARHQKLFDA